MDGLLPLEQVLEDPPEPLTRRITLRTGAAPLADVLRDIGRQAGVNVAFDTDLAATAPARTLNLPDISAAEALVQALAGTALRAYVSPAGDVVVAPPTAPGASPRPTNEPRTLQGQTVRGRVIDRDVRTPLPGANVVVLHTDPLLGTTTDPEGYFVLHGVPLGRQDLRVSFIGYEPALLSGVLVTAGKEVVLRVALAERVVTGAEVVVVPASRKEQPLNDLAVVSARAFSVEETRRYAGGVDDPARMASAFAGVSATGTVQSNALTIRGNAPKGVLWRLEGVEIPNPNHFAGLSVAGGGGLTLFSSQLLADSDFLTSAFPAEYGNALAGVFDVNFRTGNTAQHEHAAQLGLLGVDVSSEGPFVRGRPASYLFNYRYSTLALLLPLLPTEDVAKYQDLSFKLAFPAQRWGRFEVWGLGGLDAQSMAEEPDSSKWEYETWDRLNADLDLATGAIGATHQAVLGRASYVTSTAAYTYHRLAWDQRRLDDDSVLQDNLRVFDRSSRLVVRSYVNHKFSTRHVNRTGGAVQGLFYDFDLRAAPDDRPPLLPVAQGQGSSTLLQFFSQSRLALSPHLTLNAGAHAQYFALTGQASVEPRAGLRWQPHPRHAVSLGYGLHSQIEDLRLYFVQQPGPGGARTPNRRLGFTRAHHGVLGYDLQLGAASRLKLEGYYQYLFDVPVIADSSFSMLNFEQDWTFDEALVNDGAGENYGVEGTLERFLQDGYYYLLTGAVFRSRYRGGDGRWRSTRFDRGYTANVLFGKEFALGQSGNLLGLNGRMVFMGGKRRSPVDLDASLARQEVVYDEARAFADREPNLFLVDLTLTFRRNHRAHAEVWALQMMNALGAKETFPDYNFATGTVETVQEGFPLPVLSFKVEF